MRDASLIALVQDQVQSLATVSVTSGAENSDYPKENVITDEAYEVTKSTSGAYGLRLTLPAPVELDAVALINTNADTAQLTNGAGLSEAVDPDPTLEDGYDKDPWIDLRNIASATRTSDVWTVTLAGPDPVGIGVIVLIQTLRSIKFQLGSVHVEEDHPSKQHVTDYKVSHEYSLDVRTWTCKANITLPSFEDLAFSIGRSLRGALYSALLVLDPGENEARYVQLVSAIPVDYLDGPRNIPLQFTERQRGMPL